MKFSDRILALRDFWTEDKIKLSIVINILYLFLSDVAGIKNFLDY